MSLIFPIPNSCYNPFSALAVFALSASSYGKALHVIKYADPNGFPIITFVNTPGAFADLKSEELGQVPMLSSCIACCIICDAHYPCNLCIMHDLTFSYMFMQDEAIAHNLRTIFRLQVPVVTVVTGEGGSGGALAIACANKLFMLENSAFYVVRWWIIFPFFSFSSIILLINKKFNLKKRYNLYTQWWNN